jgi:hypothetical protein
MSLLIVILVLILLKFVIVFVDCIVSQVHVKIVHVEVVGHLVFLS